MVYLEHALYYIIYLKHGPSFGDSNLENAPSFSDSGLDGP